MEKEKTHGKEKQKNPLTKPKTIALILIAIAGAIYYLESTKAGPLGNGNGTDDNENNSVNGDSQGLTPYQQWENSLTQEDRERIAQKEKLFPRSPELAGISGYLNTKNGTKIEDFRGKVVLVDFWTYTCINCIRTLPYLTEWDQKYHDEGLVIIGVHTPEFEFEKEYANVRMAMDKHGIEYRVLQDNDYATWRAFKNRYWPRKYLIDADGFIRYDHIGEGGYTETERMIQTLLTEQGVKIANMTTTQLEDQTPKQQLTPELYAGYSFNLPRGQNIGNEGGLKQGEEVSYMLNAKIKPDIIYLNGKWKSNEDDLEAKSNASQIYLVYTASAVNIVATSPEPIRLMVMREGNSLTKDFAGSDVQFDEEGKSYVLISEPRLYNLICGEYDSAILALTSEKEGFSFNAFTFG